MDGRSGQLDVYACRLCTLAVTGALALWLDALIWFLHPRITRLRALRQNQHTLLSALQSSPMLTQVGTLVGA